MGRELHSVAASSITLRIRTGSGGRYGPFASSVVFSLLEAFLFLHLPQQCLELIEGHGVLCSGGIIADGSGTPASGH